MYPVLIPVPDIPATDDAAELCEVFLNTPEGEARVNTKRGHMDFQNAVAQGLWGIGATSRTTIDHTEEFERTMQ